jgi:hypothetical protein
LNLYNAALVTPTYYVYFTSATIVSSAVLYRGFKGTTIQILDVVLGFLEICAGVVLLQMSKSAKDVPDAAVFKGDLDQMRTVAEQPEPEYEPRADAIRGGSAIIRSISKARQSKQMEEARRLREEHLSMAPIGENEQIEFDGIRRRRTTIRSSRAPSIIGAPGTPGRRATTQHPPLGMSEFPEPEGHTDTEMHPGFFSHFMKRNRSSKTLPPTPGAESLPMSPVKTGDSTFDDGIVHPRPQYLSQGLPPGFVSQSETDTSYRSPAPTHVQWASSPALDRPSSRPGTLEPPAPPPHGRPNSPGSAKRQFSFQNVFHKRRTSASHEDPRPVSRGGLSFISRGASRGGTKGGTEEERAGLVKGDSSTQLSGITRIESPPEYSDPEDEWQVTDGSSPALRTVEGSFLDIEQTRLPRYTSSPAPGDTIRQVRRNTNESPRGGRQHGGSGSESQDEKSNAPGGAAFI